MFPPVFSPGVGTVLPYTEWNHVVALSCVQEKLTTYVKLKEMKQSTYSESLHAKQELQLSQTRTFGFGLGRR